MLSPEMAKVIANRVASPERFDAMAREAYEEHCNVLRAAGIAHLKSWNETGSIIQTAWKMAAASVAEDVLNIIAHAVTEVHHELSQPDD